MPNRWILASNENFQNHPELTLEKSGTWKGKDSNSWIRYTLEKGAKVSSIRIDWQAGNKVKYPFRVQFSEDGKKWTTAFKGENSGKSDKLETYNFKPATGKFLRIIGSGVKNDKPLAINFVEINGIKPKYYYPKSKVNKK